MYFRKRIVLSSAAICLLGLAAAYPLLAASFSGLGDLPGGEFESSPNAVSANGRVVVGVSNFSSGTEAFRWTQAGGMQSLGDLPGGEVYSEARAVSANGSVVVGLGTSASGPQAFRWTQEGGIQGIGDLSGVTFKSFANGISADGSVIVGGSPNNHLPELGEHNEAFRWTQEVGIQGLGDLPGGRFASEARAISADGSVIVGWSDGGRPGTLDSDLKVFRWTEAGGMQGIGDLPGSAYNAVASAVSADGSVIVGSIDTSFPSLTQAFRWTKDEGMKTLGVLPGGVRRSFAEGVSADGSIIVGFNLKPEDEQGPAVIEAFVWDEKHGMRPLRHVLVNDFGLDLTGWTLATAMGISADGLTIVGGGKNPDGQYEAWLARLGDCCETRFHRGDPNSSGETDISDGIAIFGFLFLGDPPTLSCKESADANNDGTIDISDGIYLLSWLFTGGPEPAAPGPTDRPCGVDPDPAGTAGDLGCVEYPACR